MIALPVISSLIAPTAMAQSGGETGGTIQDFSDTCTNCRTEVNATCCNGLDLPTFECDPQGGRRGVCG